MAFCGECQMFHMPSDVCGRNTLDGVAHSLKQMRAKLVAAPAPAAAEKKPRFDRAAWQREYMKTYVPKWRAARKAEKAAR
jgi:hypothetical protein